MKKRVTTVKVVFTFSLLFLFHQSAHALSLPDNWQSWTPMSTPLAKIGAIPGCDADVSTLPPIYQETVATYCAVKQGGPGKIAILVNPDAISSYKERNGKFGNGVNMLLYLKDMKLLFATFYQNGKPGYAVFTEEGKEITPPNGPLSSETCINCHTGYQAFCVNGQCGTSN